VEEITMEYGDGSEGVEPGTSISAHGEDLGAATYDSDHDGVADSVIVGQDEYTVVVTDSDHDGNADSVTGYDAQGHQVEHGPSGADAGLGGSGSDSPGSDNPGNDSPGSDTPGSDGSGSHTPSSDTPGSDGSGSHTPSSDTPGSDGSGSADPGTGAEPAGAAGDTPGDTSGDAAPGSITVVDDQGRAVEVGPPTADMDGDGTADTAIVRNTDGSTTGYTDRNADGEADQITQIGTDNRVTISVADGKGGWEVAASGHLDAHGEFVEDAGSGSAGVTTGTDGAAVPVDAAGGAVMSDVATTAGSGAADQPVDAAGVAVAEPAGEFTAADGATITYTDANGQSYQLGAPTADFDGDGTADTVVTTLENGTVVGYSDVDGDGRTDQVTQIDPDGTVTIGVPDGHGGWEEAATGHLGENGEFIADAAAPAAV